MFTNQPAKQWGLWHVAEDSDAAKSSGNSSSFHQVVRSRLCDSLHKCWKWLPENTAWKLCHAMCKSWPGVVHLEDQSNLQIWLEIGIVSVGKAEWFWPVTGPSFHRTKLTSAPALRKVSAAHQPKSKLRQQDKEDVEGLKPFWLIPYPTKLEGKSTILQRFGGFCKASNFLDMSTQTISALPTRFHPLAKITRISELPISKCPI